MNGTGNMQDICAEAVPSLRRQLIATRVIVGPKSRKGDACSNLVEQLEHMRTATGEQRANLQKAIPLQMAVLAGE